MTPARVRATLIALAVSLAIGACSSPTSARTGSTTPTVSPTAASTPAPAPTVGPATEYEGVEFTDDLDFGGPAGIRLDVCAPTDGASARAAVLAIHGGSWRSGDKQEPPWRDVCAWLASEGFVVFQTNYRLAPEHPYPAAIDDVAAAVRWIRDDDQVERFGYDPDRLAAFGDSAGGNLAALLGTRGKGERSVGDGSGAERIAAVVDLSGPIDLTLEGTRLGSLSESFQRTQLDYLGCISYDDCPQAADASPLQYIDPTDPPFFIAHSVGEFIPVEQADALADALIAAGIEVDYRRIDGVAHALTLLDPALRSSIVDWLRSTV